MRLLARGRSPGRIRSLSLSAVVPPAIPRSPTDASVASNGTTVGITFSRAMTTAGGGVLFTTASPATNLTYLAGSGGTSFLFTASATIKQTDVPTLTYTSTDLVDSLGRQIYPFAGRVMVNNSTQP